MPSMSLEERLIKYTDRTGNNGCWLWTGHCEKTGYGVLGVNNKNTRAHRAMWAHVNGPIPAGMFVCHTCDVRNCVNPDHLFLGTHQDNMIDMTRKGRQLAPNRKGPALTEDDIQRIRSLAAEGTSVRTLARTYQRDLHTIFDIIHRISWQHIT